MESMIGGSGGGSPKRLIDCSGRKLVGRLRFKPAQAVAEQNARREREKEIEEGTGFAMSEEEMTQIGELPETFHDQLRKAIAALEKRVSIEAPDWLGDPHELLSDNWDLQAHDRQAETEEVAEQQSHMCFDVFVEEAKSMVFSYLQDRAAEKAEDFHKHLTTSTWSNLQSVIAYRDRLAPRIRSIDTTCPAEDKHLYKALQKWSKEQQHVMTEIIDERLKQLLASHQAREYEEVEEVVEEVVEVVPETVVEEDPEIALAARERDLAEAMDKKAKLQAENDELQRQLEELRRKLDACNAEVNDLNGDVDRLDKLLSAPEEPIPCSEVVVAPPPPDLAPLPVPPRKAPRKAPPPIAAPVEEVVEEIDWAALEAVKAAEKEAYEKELARLIQEARNRNAKEWKIERSGLLKRIAELEDELKRLQSRQRAHESSRAHEMSRASTETPTEPSQTLEEAVSIENLPPRPPPQAQETVVVSSRPTSAAALAPPEVQRPKLMIPKSSFPIGIGPRKGPCFDELFTQAELRKVRLEEQQIEHHKAQMADFKSKEQKHQRFGFHGAGGDDGVPLDGLSMSCSDIASTDYMRTDNGKWRASGDGSRPGSGKWNGSPVAGNTGMRDSGYSGSAGHPSTRESGNPGNPALRDHLCSPHLKRGAYGVQSEGQLRVRLRGPLPALMEWLEPLQPSREGTVSRGCGSNASKKRTTKTAPYDILRPTLRQVDARCRLPTALSRMTAEPQEEPSPEPGPEPGTAAETAAG